jgi:hypothetical protein
VAKDRNQTPAKEPERFSYKVVKTFRVQTWENDRCISAHDIEADSAEDAIAKVRTARER